MDVKLYAGKTRDMEPSKYFVIEAPDIIFYLDQANMIKFYNAFEGMELIFGTTDYVSIFKDMCKSYPSSERIKDFLDNHDIIYTTNQEVNLVA